MLSNVINWIKTHKLVIVLLVVIVYFLLPRVSSMFGMNRISYPSSSFESGSAMITPTSYDSYNTAATSAKVMSPSLGIPSPQGYTPNADIADRLVIQNSRLSLLVKDVVDVRKKIIDYANSLGGYMVSSETSNPQDAPTSNITVRVPSDKLDSALENIRGLGMKVVSENIMGNDVTDQYVDIEARITTLQKTKAAMENILAQATQISDLTNITREVINIQSQIDNLKGTQKSLEQNAKLTKVTIYLSTDEIALPYTPNETFRPNVIFKLAVRSLISHLRQLGSLVIWIAVYSVIWVPVVVIYILIRKRFKKKQPLQNS